MGPQLNNSGDNNGVKTPKPDDNLDALNNAGSLEYEEKAGADSSSSSSPVTADPSLANDTSGSEGESVSDATNPAKPVKKVRKNGPLKRFWKHFNIYIVMFALLIVVAAVISTLMYLRSRNTVVTPAGNISNQKIPAETLKDLANSGVQIGDPKQTLNVQSNSVFAGAVLVRGELQVAGGLKLGSSTLSINDLTVGSNANINTLQAQTLNVAGSTRSNDMTVLRNLTVNGSSTINGGLTTPSLTVGRLQLTSDLSITRHIDAGGAAPGRTGGSALGGGGTVSVSGSDTAGTVNINTGGGPPAGCFVTVSFTSAYNGTPHIVITPVGSAAASLDYYINRTAANFSICTANSAPANSAFAFDYHVFN